MTMQITKTYPWLACFTVHRHTNCELHEEWQLASRKSKAIPKHEQECLYQLGAGMQAVGRFRCFATTSGISAVDTKNAPFGFPCWWLLENFIIGHCLATSRYLLYVCTLLMDYHGSLKILWNPPNFCPSVVAVNFRICCQGQPQWYSRHKVWVRSRFYRHCTE